MLKWFKILMWIYLAIKKIAKTTTWDNNLVKKQVNKVRVNLKIKVSERETDIIEWIIKIINKAKGLPEIHRKTLKKKYYSVINKKSNESIDELCDYIIAVYDKNF